jgi:hypothetical protein
MRILRPAGDGAEALLGAEARLAAEMLCLEHGARAVGPDLQPLPPPHEPWPTVRLGPVTAGGRPCTVHYRPTVGVVFYTLPPGGSVADLVGRLSARLELAGDGHLRGGRAVAATPATVLRHQGRIAGGHLLVGPRKCYKKPVSERGDLPARLLQWMAPGDDEPPPHYSIRAAFTWAFMPATAALAIGEAGFDSMPAVNATLAAVLYDGARLCRLPDGAEARPLTVGHFGGGGLPPFLAAPPPGAAPPPLAPLGGALLVEPGGRLVFVGRLLNLHLRAGRAAWPPGQYPALPAEAWAPETVARPPRRGRGEKPPADAASRDFQCTSCSAPLGGRVAVVRAPGGAAPEPPGMPLCMFCWHALDSPAYLTGHVGARVTQTETPFTQAEAAAACPGYERLAPLLAGTATAIPGAAGAFVVRIPEGAAGVPGGVGVVLASEKLGRYPAVTNPAILAMDLAVVPGLALAEVAPGAAPRAGI